MGGATGAERHAGQGQYFFGIHAARLKRHQVRAKRAPCLLRLPMSNHRCDNAMPGARSPPRTDPTDREVAQMLVEDVGLAIDVAE